VPGVRMSGVFLLPGVGPALAALRNGVLGCGRAFGVVVMVCSGDRRSFLRADSDILGAVVVVEFAMGLLIAIEKTRRWDALSLHPRLILPRLTLVDVYR
jgi:hypothetical protein